MLLWTHARAHGTSGIGTFTKSLWVVNEGVDNKMSVSVSLPTFSCHLSAPRCLLSGMYMHMSIGGIEPFWGAVSHITQ